MGCTTSNLIKIKCLFGSNLLHTMPQIYIKSESNKQLILIILYKLLMICGSCLNGGFCFQLNTKLNKWMNYVFTVNTAKVRTWKEYVNMKKFLPTLPSFRMLALNKHFFLELWIQDANALFKHTFVHNSNSRYNAMLSGNWLIK